MPTFALTDQLLDEIADAMRDQHGGGLDHTWRFNLSTGQVDFSSREWDDDDKDEDVDDDDADASDGSIDIDPVPSFEWSRDMTDFAAGVEDETASRALDRALDGKGAFRRFAIVVFEQLPHLADSWNDLRERRGRQRAIEWLEDFEIIDEDTAEELRSGDADPA